MATPTIPSEIQGTSLLSPIIARALAERQAAQQLSGNLRAGTEQMVQAPLPDVSGLTPPKPDALAQALAQYAGNMGTAISGNPALGQQQFLQGQQAAGDYEAGRTRSQLASINNLMQQRSELLQLKLGDLDEQRKAAQAAGDYVKQAELLDMQLKTNAEAAKAQREFDASENAKNRSLRAGELQLSRDRLNFDQKTTGKQEARLQQNQDDDMMRSLADIQRQVVQAMKETKSKTLEDLYKKNSSMKYLVSTMQSMATDLVKPRENESAQKFYDRVVAVTADPGLALQFTKSHYPNETFEQPKDKGGPSGTTTDKPTGQPRGAKMVQDIVKVSGPGTNVEHAITQATKAAVKSIAGATGTAQTIPNLPLMGIGAGGTVPNPIPGMGGLAEALGGMSNMPIDNPILLLRYLMSPAPPDTAR